jgi:hypothetical protein
MQILKGSLLKKCLHWIESDGISISGLFHVEFQKFVSVLYYIYGPPLPLGIKYVIVPPSYDSFCICVTSRSKLAIISPQADNPYQGRLVQKIYNSASRASYCWYYRCHLLTNINCHTKMSGGKIKRTTTKIGKCNSAIMHVIHEYEQLTFQP